jgi:molybdopterin-guanine dinucleotide biosynthesis protein A
MPDGADVTLGILAGGRASRLGGRDKAWLRRAGVPQVVWIATEWSHGCGAVLVSANRLLPRYAEHGLHAVADHAPDLGPLGGLQALAAACGSVWLFSVPVDATQPGAGALAALQAAGRAGAALDDDDGPQPLVALYRIDALRPALAAAIAAGELSVQSLQARMGLPRVRCDGLRVGNLNTPLDLALAGYADE